MEITVEKELKDQALTLRDQALAIKVKDVEAYASAGVLGKSMKELRAKVVEYFSPLKAAAHLAHTAITTREREELKPIDDAIGILKMEMNKFTAEQERIRKAEEDRLKKLAEEAAEKERQRLLKQAEKAEAKGNGEKAEELLEKAADVYVPPVTVESRVDKTVRTESGNITQAKEITVEVTNMMEFITELVRLKSAPTMLEAKPAALKAWIKANDFSHFPGLSIKRGTGVRF